MHSLKGLARFPQILTEADVLLHCYGVSDGSLIPDAVPAPEPVVEIPPPAPSEPPPPPAPSEPPPPPSDEEMAATLESGNSKPELVAMAEAAGLDQSGTKAELSARLVAHYRGR